jgi:hypothetical protein
MIKQEKKCHRRSVIGKKLSGMCHKKKVSINVTDMARTKLSHIFRNVLIIR